MKKKEICFILPKGFPVPNVKGGAIETLITNLINRNEVCKKMNFTVVSLYHKEVEGIKDNYSMTNFIYIKKDLLYYIKSFVVRLHNLISKEKYNTYNEYVLSKIKHKNFDLIIVEDGNYFCFKHYLKYFDKSKLVLHMHHDGISNENLGNTYDKFIGISNFVTNKFKTNSNINKFYTLMNGIDLDKFKKEITITERTNLRKKYGFSDNDFVVLFCGRIIKVKGVLELMHAINSIKNDNIKLLIVGSANFSENSSTDYEKEVNNIINNSTNIKVTGYIKNEELYKYYQIADIQVVPSLWEEAAGLVTIEGMISSLPLIVTNSGGMVEYVSDETIVVERNEQIIKSLSEKINMLYNDKNKMDIMKESGIKTANKFGVHNFYNSFYDIVMSMVGDKNE